MHIYQCFLVLIVALMHLPNTYENLWKTKTQAPWPPLLYFYLFFYTTKHIVYHEVLRNMSQLSQVKLERWHKKCYSI